MTLGILCFLGGLGFQELIVIGLTGLIPVVIIRSLALSKQKNESTVGLSSNQFATFGKRLFARVMDSLMVNTVTFIFVFVVDQRSTLESVLLSSNGLALMVYCWIYQPLFECKGGTVGKRMLGLKTIDLATGLPPTIGKSYLRSLLYFFLTVFGFFPWLLSVLAVLWSARNQTWYDGATSIGVIVNTVKGKSIVTNSPGHSSILQHANKLRELKSLQEQGIISNDEFESEKKKILDS